MLNVIVLWVKCMLTFFYWSNDNTIDGTIFQNMTNVWNARMIEMLGNDIDVGVRDEFTANWSNPFIERPTKDHLNMMLHQMH